MSCIVSSKEIQAATKKTILKINTKKKKKQKDIITICESKNYNRWRFDQKLNSDTPVKSQGENNKDRSFLLLGTESNWNGFSEDDKKQSSGEQGTKYKKDFYLHNN